MGQAVFGWIPNWQVADLETEAGTNRVTADTQSACYERSDPMNWILENRVRSSPFWRTTRRLIELAFPDSAHPWYSHVAWTNIYPIGRNDVKGNPVGELRTSQTSAAAQLLDVVASATRPKAVVILGGSYWWDVAGSLPLDDPAPVGRPLLAGGSRGGVPWVVGWHPGGAQRRGWGADRYAAHIVEMIGRLGSADAS